jgi:hypothetical protein
MKNALGKSYKLMYQDTVFAMIAHKPPMLIRLGSGEIIRWKNTIDNCAIYKLAEIEDYTYVHSN